MCQTKTFTFLPTRDVSKQKRVSSSSNILLLSNDLANSPNMNAIHLHTMTVNTIGT